MNEQGEKVTRASRRGMTAREHREIKPGIMIESKCGNADCRMNGLHFITTLGFTYHFTSHSLPLLLNSPRNFFCPACGRQQRGPAKVYVANAVCRFKEEEKNEFQTHGELLCLPTRADGQTARELFVDPLECAVCLESLPSHAWWDSKVLLCGHEFHKKCVRAVTKCPLCRDERCTEGPQKIN